MSDNGPTLGVTAAAPPTTAAGAGGERAAKRAKKDRTKAVQALLREKEKELKEMLAPEKTMAGEVMRGDGTTTM